MTFVKKNQLLTQFHPSSTSIYRNNCNFAALFTRFSAHKGILGDPLAQLAEHNTFNVGVLGSSPKRITEKGAVKAPFFVFITRNGGHYTFFPQIGYTGTLRFLHTEYQCVTSVPYGTLKVHCKVHHTQRR